MSTLDELERLVIKPQLSYEERHLLELHRLETLPALIRVARAAEALRYAVSDHMRRDAEECWEDLAKPERDLNEALQQLIDLEGK